MSEFAGDVRPQLLGTWGARSADALLDVLRGPGALAADVIELRLDLPRDGAARVHELVAASPRPVLATCRRAAGGGGFTAGERDRVDVLLRAAAAGAAWLDVEDDVAERDVERLLGSGAKLLRSRHVDRLGDDAEDVAARLLGLPGGAAKLVALRGTAADALRMLTLVRSAPGRLAAHVAAVPFTRPASAALGAPFVYAALAPGGRIGVPMPTVLQLRRRARFDWLRPGCGVFVLIGAHVEGSVSPDMLNAAFESKGPDAVALRWSCDDPEPALEAVRRFEWLGAAVTTPHKGRVAELVSAEGRMGSRAAECDAVNTVLREGNALAGRNTDMAGLVEALTPHVEPSRLKGRAFLILGAGGAARAAIAVARGFGARPVVLARRPEAAESMGCQVVRSAEEAAMTRPLVVVDATPAGPPGGVPFFDPARLLEPAVVLHMLVHHAPTAVLAAAARAGHRAVPGFEMLLAQAARQVTLLSGDPRPDRHAMRDAGEAWLRRRDTPILLVGLRCAGKTSVGERLAKILGRRFTDADAEAARIAGRPVESMLEAGDEAEFRRIERDVLVALKSAPAAVIACGGGAALHAEALAELAASGAVVLLDAPDEVLLARRETSPRTALTARPAAEELALQRADRMPGYRAAAKLTVDAASGDAEAVAEHIAAWWDALPL